MNKSRIELRKKQAEILRLLESGDVKELEKINFIEKRGIINNARKNKDLHNNTAIRRLNELFN